MIAATPSDSLSASLALVSEAMKPSRRGLVLRLILTLQITDAGLTGRALAKQAPSYIGNAKSKNCVAAKGCEAIPAGPRPFYSSCGTSRDFALPHLNKRGPPRIDPANQPRLPSMVGRPSDYSKSPGYAFLHPASTIHEAASGGRRMEGGAGEDGV